VQARFFKPDRQFKRGRALRRRERPMRPSARRKGVGGIEPAESQWVLGPRKERAWQAKKKGAKR